MDETTTKVCDARRGAIEATSRGIWKAADKLAKRLEDELALTSRALRKVMNEVSDANQDEHRWNWGEAYDAAEIAVNRRVRAATTSARSASEGGLLAIEAALRLARLETPQTHRRQATDALQQFSTPIEIAVAVIEAATIRAGDTVLEPSAGTGVLATLAAAHLDEVHGGRLLLNEIDAQRATLLRRMFGDCMVSEEDAEALSRTDPNIQPSVIVMNPPFTTRRANGTMRRNADLAHLAAACRLVAPARGRVVAVTSCAAEPGTARWTRALGGIEPTPRVRASIVVDGRLFRSRGTNAQTRLTIIELAEKEGESMVSRTAKDGARAAQNRPRTDRRTPINVNGQQRGSTAPP